MSHKTRIRVSAKKIYLVTALIFIAHIVLNSCASTKPELRVAFYNFEYNQENYRLRSVTSPDKTVFYNDLIGHKFVAKDNDQDGCIDEIILGESSLADAQIIYEYALDELTRQNRLGLANNSIDVFQHTNSVYDYEIKSIRASNTEALNEFKIIYKNRLLNPQVIICIDKKADGTVDDVVKGSMTLDKIQLLYTDIIQKGLQDKGLIEVDNMILVNRD